MKKFHIACLDCEDSNFLYLFNIDKRKFVEIDLDTGKRKSYRITDYCLDHPDYACIVDFLYQDKKSGKYEDAVIEFHKDRKIVEGFDYVQKKRR